MTFNSSRVKVKQNKLLYKPPQKVTFYKRNNIKKLTFEEGGLNHLQTALHIALFRQEYLKSITLAKLYSVKSIVLHYLSMTILLACFLYILIQLLLTHMVHSLIILKYLSTYVMNIIL